MGRQHTNRIHQEQIVQWDTVASLAYELRVSDKTIRRQIKMGALKAYSIGRELRISPTSKQDFLDSIVFDPANLSSAVGGA